METDLGGSRSMTRSEPGFWLADYFKAKQLITSHRLISELGPDNSFFYIDEAGAKGPLECTPKVRQEVKGPATLNGGERCWCPDKNIPAN